MNSTITAQVQKLEHNLQMDIDQYLQAGGDYHTVHTCLKQVKSKN